MQKARSGMLVGMSLMATIAAGALLLRWLAQQDLTTIAAGATAAAALPLLVVGIARARSHDDLDASTLLVLAVAVLPTLPIVAVVVSGGVVRELDVSRQLAPLLPGWYDGAVYVGLGMVIAVAALLLAMRLVLKRRRVTINVAALLAILLWLLTWLASGLHGGRLISLSGAAMLVSLLAAAALPRGRGACLGAAIFGVSLAEASGVLATVRFDLATVPCRGTCLLGSALTGVFSNENLLATALVASLPFVYLGFRDPLRIPLTLYVAAIAFATGSRGAMVAVVIIVAALLVLRPDLDAGRPAPARTALAGTLLAASLFAAVFIVEPDWSSRYNLDNRPLIWNVASRYIDESPLFGYGPDKWETLYSDTGEIPLSAEHSTHNQLVDVRFRAGWVGAVVLFAMMAAILLSAGPARMAVLIVLATVFLIGVTERAWAIGTVDFASFSLIATILLGTTATRARRPDTAAAPPDALALTRRRDRVAALSGSP